MMGFSSQKSYVVHRGSLRQGTPRLGFGPQRYLAGTGMGLERDWNGVSKTAVLVVPTTIFDSIRVRKVLFVPTPSNFRYWK